MGVSVRIRWVRGSATTMGAAGNGAFAGEHRAGRKVGTIGERHGTFRKEISRTVPAVAGLLHGAEQLKCKTDQTCLYRFGLFCHKIRTEKDSEKVGFVGKDENQKGRNLPQRRPDG